MFVRKNEPAQASMAYPSEICRSPGYPRRYTGNSTSSARTLSSGDSAGCHLQRQYRPGRSSVQTQDSMIRAQANSIFRGRATILAQCENLSMCATAERHHKRLETAHDDERESNLNQFCRIFHTRCSESRPDGSSVNRGFSLIQIE